MSNTSKPPVSNYRIEILTFKSSGKYYSNGKVIPLGIHPQYPSELFRKHTAEIYEDLDTYSNLPQGVVKANGLIVQILLLDDTSNPIVHSELVL